MRSILKPCDLYNPSINVETRVYRIDDDLIYLLVFFLGDDLIL